MRHDRLAVLVPLLTLGALAPLHAEDAARLFSSKCAMCHGADGKGATLAAKALGAKSLVGTTLSDKEVAQTISEGRKRMPAYKGKLSPEEISQLAQFIKAGLKASK